MNTQDQSIYGPTAPAGTIGALGAGCPSCNDAGVVRREEDPPVEALALGGVGNTMPCPRCATTEPVVPTGKIETERSTDFSKRVDWFPAWMDEWQPAIFWKGLLRWRYASGSKGRASYETITSHARDIAGRASGVPVSKRYFERERHTLKQVGRDKNDPRFETLIPMPRSIKPNMRPPWVDDPSLLDPFRPAGETLPLPEASEDEEDEPLTVTLTIGGQAVQLPLMAGTKPVILCRSKNGLVRALPLQRAREWLDYTHSIAALFLALLMLASVSDWLDPDHDGVIDALHFALRWIADVCVLRA